MAHTCHAKRCRTACKPECLMCLAHWRMVSPELQREVWRTYRPGQCDDMSPSAEWFVAANAAIDAVDAIERARAAPAPLAPLPLLARAEAPKPPAVARKRRLQGLTLKQPWAWAVCCAGKAIENREWKPGATILEPGDFIAIHAGQGVDDEGFAFLRGLGFSPPVELVRGGIVAVARFGGVVTEHPSPWFFGPFGWLFEDVRVFERPIPCGGATVLWSMNDEIQRRVRAAWRASGEQV